MSICHERTGMKRGGSLYTFFYSLVYLCGFYFCPDLAIFWVFPVSNCDTHRGGGDTYTRKQIRVLLCSNIRVRHTLDKKEYSLPRCYLSHSLSLHQFSLIRFLRSFCYFSFFSFSIWTRKRVFALYHGWLGRGRERENEEISTSVLNRPLAVKTHRGPSFRPAFLQCPKQNMGGKRPNKF